MIVSYTWLKDFLGEEAPTAAEVAELLTFHSFEIEEVKEVNGDTLIDVDVLPNRSSDCLSHRGIAREIATLLDMTLAYDPLFEAPALQTTEAISVEIEDAKACPRFTASLMTGITVKDSPAWLRERLEAIGARSINNVVDATNYVMYALGQPLHAYDAELFPQSEGAWQFVVRKARTGETVSLLAEGTKEEDRVIECTGTELLIVDGSSDTPIGLAGVKGGQYAGVHAGTTSIIVEAAHFDPTLTRQTARGLGIVIDASKRFENEPPRDLPIYAQGEIIELIKEIAGGTCEGVFDRYLEKKRNPQVAVRTDKVNALLGLQLTLEEMVQIVRRLGAVVEETADGFAATAPFERTDLLIEEDYIEEIGRIHGLSNIESILPDTVPLKEINVRQYYSERIRHTLIEIGFSEVITSSFTKKDEVQLKNALASDKSYLRSKLSNNIDAALTQNVANLDLLGLSHIQLFEIGTVFNTDENGHVAEHVSLALGVRTKRSGYTSKDDVALQTAIELVHESLGTTLEWTVEQGVAEANLSEVLNTLAEPTSYDAYKATTDITYQPYSQYPSVSRDIALWTTEDITPADVEDVLNEHAGTLRVRTTLFDEFTKEGRTSYAFRLVFQSNAKTLTDSEVNKVMEKVYESVKEKGWEVR